MMVPTCNSRDRQEEPGILGYPGLYTMILAPPSQLKRKKKRSLWCWHPYLGDVRDLVSINGHSQVLPVSPEPEQATEPPAVTDGAHLRASSFRGLE